MADNVQDVPVAQPAAQPDANQELARNMELALGKEFVSQPAAGTPAPDGQPATDPTPAQPVVDVNPFARLTEKFGYQSHEDAIQEIEQLRGLRDNPQMPEVTFSDENSQNLFRAFTGGKLQEVYEYLDKELRIDRLLGQEIGKDNAADIVKYGMQLKYKDLTPEEIAYKFNQQFKVPAQPVRMAEEDDIDFNQRMSDWQEIASSKQMELMIEAKLLRPDLQNFKTKFTLPQIQDSPDENYVQWQKSMQDRERQDTETINAYKVFTPQMIEDKIDFKDEPNGINFQFQFTPDTNSFEESRQVVSDINLLWQRFTKPDGTPDRQGFFRFIYNGLNHDKIVMAAMNQAKNAVIKNNLPDNSQGGLVRNMPQPQGEQSELDKQMREALKGFGGF